MVMVIHSFLIILIEMSGFRSSCQIVSVELLQTVRKYKNQTQTKTVQTQTIAIYFRKQLIGLK